MSPATGPEARGARRAAHLILACLAAYVLLLGLLLGRGGGLLGRYSIRDAAGEEITVDRRVDREINFPVPQRLDAAYIDAWDMARLGFPANKPLVSIQWTGLLRVPRRGAYGFSVEAQGTVAVAIDGRTLELRTDALTERDLDEGLHPITVDYSLAEGEARIVLSFRPPGQTLGPIPSSFLAPDVQAIESDRKHRAAGFGLLLAGAAAVVGTAVASRRKVTGAARLVARLGAERPRLALGAILILAALVRLHDYALVPFHHETADEYQHAWEGWSLLHDGVPAAWSTFPDRYPIEQTLDLKWFGDRYVLVRPYFDHPPLFSILVGLANSALASPRRPPGWLPPLWADTFTCFNCSLRIARLVPIIMSLAGLLLGVRLARAYGASERAALLGALVYATLPVIVLAHRLVKGESLLTLLFMAAILAALRHRETGEVRQAALAGALCGLSLWTKATGVAVPLIVVLILVAARRYRGALVALALTLGFFGLYLLYAWWYGFGIFLKVMAAQATTKWVSLDAMQDLLQGNVVTRLFGRGTYLFLLFAAGWAAFRKERALLLPVAVYALIIALTADQRVIYGWYRIPLYPFLCIAAGLYLEEMIERSDLFGTFPFSAAAVSSGLLYALPAAFAQSKQGMALFALLATAPFLPRLAREGPLTARLARAGAYLLLGVFLVTSVATLGNILDLYPSPRGLR